MVRETMTSRERMVAAVRLEPYDRVPVAPLVDVMFPSRYKGMTLAEGIGNWRKGFDAILAVYDDVGGWDGMLLPGYSVAARPKISGGVGLGRRLMPGRDLDADAVPQYVETERLKREDYDEIIEYGWSRSGGFLERHRSELNPFPVEKIIEWTKRQMSKYIAEIEAWNERGVPTLIGGSTSSPLMTLSTIRSMVEFTKDLYRIPDKVEAVMNAMVDDLIADVLMAVQITKAPGAWITLERGGGFYYPLRLFERFEWPFMKKMILAFWAEGLFTNLHFDQDWTINLPYLKELPRGSCIVELDSMTDIFKAKEILRDHMCIAGDVPAALTSLGTPEEVTAYCQKLIDVVGEGGGFILSSGCTVPADCRFENFKAMIDTAKNYWPY